VQLRVLSVHFEFDDLCSCQHQYQQDDLV
jgi:hypothetical protein